MVRGYYHVILLVELFSFSCGSENSNKSTYRYYGRRSLPNWPEHIRKDMPRGANSVRFCKTGDYEFNPI